MSCIQTGDCSRRRNSSRRRRRPPDLVYDVAAATRGMSEQTCNVRTFTVVNKKAQLTQRERV